MPDAQAHHRDRSVVLDENYARMHSDVRPGRYAMIAVSDTGTGIPAAILDKVFNPFFTSKGPARAPALAQHGVRLLKQSGGHIMIYSEESHGTTSKRYLPPATGTLPAAEATLCRRRKRSRKRSSSWKTTGWCATTC